MKYLKSVSLFLISLNVVFLTSCGDDDSNCTPPVVSENIIGTWTVLGSTVEFKSDGTLNDPDDAIFGTEVNGVVYDQKTYVATESILFITAMPTNGTGFSTGELEIVSSECDRIIFSILGIEVNMNRK